MTTRLESKSRVREVSVKSFQVAVFGNVTSFLDWY